MRRDLLFIGILLTIVAVFYTNEIIRIDYNLNLYEYVMLSSEYTDEEQRVLERYGTLKYGGNMMEPPLGNYYEDTGQYLGLVTDFIYALAIELGTDIVMQPMIWEDALTALENGEIDLCDLTPSRDRSKNYLFTDPIYDLNGTVLKSSKNDNIVKVADLNGIKVGVQKGDFIIESLDSRGIYPEYIYADNLTEALELLYSGQVEAVVGDEPVMKYHLNEPRYVDNYEILNERVYESFVVLGLPKSHEELNLVLNKAIFRMKKSGVLQKIQGKWLGTDSVAEERRMNEKMKRNFVVIFTLFAVIIYLVYAWNRNLKNLVDERTYELRELTGELETILDNIKSTIFLLSNDGRIKKTKGSIPGWRDHEENMPSSIDELDFFKELGSNLADLTGQGLTTIHDAVSLDVSYQNRIYECHVTPIAARSPLILVIATDETVERIQKAQIFHSNKMAAIGRLAAGIAHELRNPLGVVRNSTFILKDSEFQDDDEKLAVEAIDRSVERAGIIIENLLNYSRLAESPKEKIHLKKILEEILSYYRKSPENRKIEFSLRMDDNIVIDSSESAIRHIVTNLIGNSIDAMDGEGALLVEVELRYDNVILNVRDTGKGILPEEMDRIFDPFFTTKSQSKGTGLGLYIVYSQIEKLGGTIQVTSELNKGSSFAVTIPKR